MHHLLSALKNNTGRQETDYQVKLKVVPPQLQTIEEAGTSNEDYLLFH